MLETGTVLEAKGATAVVRIQRHSACGKCKGCELGDGSRSFIDLEALNELNVQEGDLVRIELQSPEILKAAMIAYGIPLAALLIGLLLGYLLFPIFGISSDLFSVVLALLLMILSLGIVRKMDQKMGSKRKMESRIVEIIQPLL